MTVLTKTLRNFAIFFLVGTIVFRFCLSHFIDNHSYPLIWTSAVLFFVYNFGIGWYFGKKDHETLPIFDIGFRFHLVTYLIFNIVSEIWFLMGFQSQFETIVTIHCTAIIWGTFVLIHGIFYLIARRRSINGLNRSELFE